MIVRLPVESRWSPDYQGRANAELERAFGRLNEYALVKPGGSARQALVKASDRDFDLAWGGQDRRDLELRSNWVHYGSSWRRPTIAMSLDGIVVVNAIIKGGATASGTIVAAVPERMRPSAHVGYFLCHLSAGGTGLVYVGADGLVRSASALDSGYTMMNFTYTAG